MNDGRSRSILKASMVDHKLFTSRPPSPINSMDLRKLDQSRGSGEVNFHIRNDGLIINDVDSQLNIQPAITKSSVATGILGASRMTTFACNSRNITLKTPVQSTITLPFSAGVSKRPSKRELTILEPERPVIRKSKYIQIPKTFIDSKGNAVTVKIGYKNIQRVGVGYQFGYTDIDVSLQDLYELPPGLLNPRGICLNVSDNYLQTLNGIRMPYLTKIDASNNELTEFGDFGSPTEALRIANFSKNCIKKALNLQTFWALTELNLSHNEIDEVYGIDELEYLTKLDLSHNRFTEFPPISSSSLVTLNLNSNNLYEIPDFKSCPHLVQLGLAFNSISDLEPLKHCTRLLKLWLQENSINDLHQLANLKPILGLNSLTLYPNPIAAVGMYRSMIIFTLPQLLVLDAQKIQAKEKVEAKNIFSPDLAELVARDRIENMVERASQSGSTLSDEFIYKRQLPPVILLVGAPLSRCSQIASMLKVKYRNKVHLGGVHSTATTLEIPIPNKDIPVSYETFAQMKSRGEFLARSHILGRACGFTSSQILRAAERSGGKSVLVASVPLAVALAIRDYDIRPRVVLVTPPHVYENPFIHRTNIWDELDHDFDDESGVSTPLELDQSETPEDTDRATTFTVRLTYGPDSGRVSQEDDARSAKRSPSQTSMTQCDSSCILQGLNGLPPEPENCQSDQSLSGNQPFEESSKRVNQEPTIERKDLFPSSQPVQLIFNRIHQHPKPQGTSSPVEHHIIRHTRDTLYGVPSYEIFFTSPSPPPHTSDPGVSNNGPHEIGPSTAAPCAILYPLSHESFKIVGSSCEPISHICASIAPNDGSRPGPSNRRTKNKPQVSRLNTNCCPAVSNLDYPLLPNPVYCLKKAGEPDGIKCYYPILNSQQTPSKGYGMNCGIFFDGSFPTDFFSSHNLSVKDSCHGETRGESGSLSILSNEDNMTHSNTPSYTGSLCEYADETTSVHSHSDAGQITDGAVGGEITPETPAQDHHSFLESLKPTSGVTTAHSEISPPAFLSSTKEQNRTAITTSKSIIDPSSTSNKKSTKNPNASVTSSSHRKSLIFASNVPSSVSDSRITAQPPPASSPTNSLASLMLPVFMSDGKVVTLQKHQQALANSIIKTREEYIQFHQDHPGVFQIVVDYPGIEDCFQAVCTLVEQALTHSAEKISDPCAPNCNALAGKNSLWKNHHDGKIFHRNIHANYINLSRTYCTGNA